MEDIKELIEEINSRKPKDYEKMDIEQISNELHKVMEFEQTVLKKIKLFEDDHQDQDLIKYAKMIYKKIIERETLLIQETYLKKIDSKYIVRGLRNSADFEFEKKIAHFNNSLKNLETIFVLTSPENSFISSSIVREIINNNGDFKKFVPKSVKF